MGLLGATLLAGLRSCLPRTAKGATRHPAQKLVWQTERQASLDETGGKPGAPPEVAGTLPQP